MIKKRYISAIFLTSVISLMGTGFSSWLIGENNPETSTNGTINVDGDILDYNEYLYYDTSTDSDGVSIFSYSEFGFLTSTGATTTLGQIKAYLILNVDNCKSYFDKYSSIRLKSILKIKDSIETDLDMFNSSYLASKEMIEYSSSTYGDGTTYAESKDFINTNRGVNSSFLFSDFLANYSGLFTLTLTYSFIIPLEDFEEYIAPYLIKDNVSFSLSFRLKGE